MSSELPLLPPDDAALINDKARGSGRLVGLHPQALVEPPQPLPRRKVLSAEVVTSVPEQLCQRYCLLPLHVEGNVLHLAMHDPANVIAIDDMRLITGFEIAPLQLDESVIRGAIDRGECEPIFDALEALGMTDLLEALYVASTVPPPAPRSKTPRERINEEAYFPLRALEVDARLSGPFASVKVRQRFGNPYDVAIEALYIFPLSADAAVHAFRMRVGSRVVESALQERKQARETYETGKREGYRAALIEQDRDNVFTVSVGNLPPGEEVDIELDYAERLECNGDYLTFRFPLVVAPRYIPGLPLERSPQGDGVALDTHRVPEASRITPPMLPPELHGGAELKMQVHLEAAGRFPRHLACSQHATAQQADGDDVVVSLARQDELLNRDFILQFRLAASEPQALLLVNRDTRHFMLSVLPPQSAPPPKISRDVVFLLDRSGSMGGAKMQSARQAVLHFLDSLAGDDRFMLVAFDEDVDVFDDGQGPRPLSRRDAACEWLASIDARGGTEIREPIRRLLAMKPARGRLLYAVVITDGQVGNESEIYDMVARSASPMRFFTLGIDTAVNDAFLRRLAELGRGSCELVTPGEALENALGRLARDTGHALLTELQLVDRGLRPVKDSICPRILPDLFASRPLWISGRARASGGVELRANMGTSDWSCRVAATRSSNPAISVLWARERVKALEDLIRLQPDARVQLEADIVSLALEYGLLTRFTSFVLVDRSEVVNPAAVAQTVVQPVEMPAQWQPQGFTEFGGFGASDLVCVEESMKDLSLADFGMVSYDTECDRELGSDCLADEVSLDKLKELVDEAPIIRIVSLILSQAIKDGADLIVIEAKQGRVTVSYRCNGKLEEVMSPPVHIVPPLLGRLMVLAAVDPDQLGQVSQPLTGRTIYTLDGQTFELTMRFALDPDAIRAEIELRAVASVAPAPS
jgi:Ca-activated chloride channel family protein